ncbi:MAG: Fic family protein [Streptosporangiaceae bacterium]
MADPLVDVAALEGVPEAVDDARAAVDLLLRHRVLRLRAGEVAAESSLRGGRASAALEGDDVPLERVRSGETSAPGVQGALRIGAEVSVLLPMWAKAPRQVLARLHVLAAATVLPADACGRPRTGPPSHDPLGLGGAPPPEEVLARLDALVPLLTRETSAPAVVLGAVVHGELLALRPFAWGNGLVARAAERLTLVACGLDPKAVGIPEVGHLERSASYAQSIRAYATGRPEGVATWVRHCAAAVALGARESTAICQALLRG